MARRKYIKDYKLVHSVDEKGKVRTRAEYAGDRFCFVQEREAIRRQAQLGRVALAPAQLHPQIAHQIRRAGRAAGL